MTGVIVDDSWTKKQLRAECKSRGVYKGCSQLDKADFIRHLNASQRSNKAIGGSSAPSNTAAEKPSTVTELRAECERKGLKGYRKLKKDELVRLLKGSAKSKKTSSETGLEDLTLQQLREECKRREMKGFSKLKKEDLIQRMKDCELEKDRRNKSQGKNKINQKKAQRGPLGARAQERFEAGPSPLDTPGFLYIYYEPKSTSNTAAVTTASDSTRDRVRDWKIGKTTLDPPERRMQQSAGKNGKSYTLRASWRVPWCGYVEKIVHLDLEDLQIVPAKERADGGGIEDGGTEWFHADIALIEARVLLTLRMVRARAADESDRRTNRLRGFLGVFSCCLPVALTRRRKSRDTAGEDGDVVCVGVVRSEGKKGVQKAAI